MNKEIIEKTKQEIEEYLRNSEEHQDKQIQYILINSKTNETNTLVSNYDEAIEFTPYTKQYPDKYGCVPEWDFNFDYYVFNLLEEGYEVGYMNMETHYNLWNSIHELYPEDIDYKDGVQNYLQYCKDNNITKEKIDKEVNLETPNIMEFYKEQIGIGDIIEYKGFVIEVNDVNFDNENENIVQIYKNKQDHIDGEIIESVSLNVVDLKQNIKDYIDETYFDNNKENKNEKDYFVFVLGYDLLNDMFKNSFMNECDVSYEFANYIVDKFMNTNEYKFENKSAYELLANYCSENKQSIQNEYDNFIGINDNKHRALNNGIRVVDLGYRREQPIALVEKNIGDTKQYIIAFHYKITDNNIEWAYGKYYNNDLNKAKQDFKKILSGGDVADSLKNKDKER